MTTSTQPPIPEARALFDHARTDLRWLQDDGYGASFQLDYRSQHAGVLIGVFLFISEFTVFIRPPSVRAGSAGSVDLRRILRVLGRPVPGSLPPDRASLAQLQRFFDGYLCGLRALRHHELSGDWSRFDRARDEASDRAWRRRIGIDEPAGQRPTGG
jgi:hypothetical protein